MIFSHALRPYSPQTIPLRILDDLGVQALGVLDVDGLDVRVQLLLGALLVVSLSGDADTETERNALDAGFPNLLVELRVEADVLGALVYVLAELNGTCPHAMARESCEVGER
jgi:hypothetical protein